MGLGFRWQKILASLEENLNKRIGHETSVLWVLEKGKREDRQEEFFSFLIKVAETFLEGKQSQMGIGVGNVLQAALGMAGLTGKFL